MLEEVQDLECRLGLVVGAAYLDADWSNVTGDAIRLTMEKGQRLSVAAE